MGRGAPRALHHPARALTGQRHRPAHELGEAVGVLQLRGMRRLFGAEQLAPEDRREAAARAVVVEGGAAPGPTEKDVSDSSGLSPEQRTAMVQGMVARLAERLKTEGSDVDGWLRLLRSYMVLGDRDKALAAAADARRALASEPDKLRRVNELIKGLGLES